MLKLIDPVLTAEVLYVLAQMGHGDEIVVADANFPAASTAARTPHGGVLNLPISNLGRCVSALLSLLPLDTLVADSACRMLIDGDPQTLPPVQQEAQEAIRKAEGPGIRIIGIERQAFYERAGKAYAVVLTGERRFYGSLILRKGVIDPENIPAVV